MTLPRISVNGLRWWVVQARGWNDGTAYGLGTSWHFVATADEARALAMFPEGAEVRVLECEPGAEGQPYRLPPWPKEQD